MSNIECTEDNQYIITFTLQDLMALIFFAIYIKNAISFVNKPWFKNKIEKI